MTTSRAITAVPLDASSMRATLGSVEPDLDRSVFEAFDFGDSGALVSGRLARPRRSSETVEEMTMYPLASAR